MTPAELRVLLGRCAAELHLDHLFAEAVLRVSQLIRTAAHAITAPLR